MYPGNPNLIEKSVWSKADELQREVENANKYPIQTKSTPRILAIISLLIAMGWLFTLVF